MDFIFKKGLLVYLFMRKKKNPMHATFLEDPLNLLQ